VQWCNCNSGPNVAKWSVSRFFQITVSAFGNFISSLNLGDGVCMSIRWESNTYISVWNTFYQIWISGVLMVVGPTSLSSQPCLVWNTVFSSTCKGTSKIWIQVIQYKFIFRYIMGTWNFWEFIRFLQKCLNPQKIQGRFNFQFVPEFITLNPEGIWSWDKN
jgi:hypothetical protein